MRFIAPHKLAVLLVLVLLVGQAFAELSLPRYTSNIVDVGIQQSGVEHVAADELSARTYTLASLLLDAGDRDQLAQSYDKTDTGTYRLNDAGRDHIDQLDSLLSVALVVAHSGTNDTNGETGATAGETNETTDVDETAAGETENTSETSEESVSVDPIINNALADANLPAYGIDGLINAYSAGDITESQRATVAADINKGVTAQSEAGGESLLEQQAIAATIIEYEDLGYDLSSIQMDYLLSTGLIMLLLAAACMIFAILVGLIAARTGARIGFDLRNSLFTQVVSFSEGDVGYFSAASLITRGTNDIQLIQNTIIMFMRTVLYAPILAIGGVIMVMFTNASMGWIIVVAVVVVFAGIMILFGIAMPKFRIIQKLIDRVNLVAREILSGLAVIRAFDRESFESDRFDQASTRLMKTQLFTNRVMAFMMPFSALIMNAVSVAIVWFGGFYVDSGVVQTGDLIAFITYSMVIIMGFMMIGMVAMMLPRANVAAGRICEVLDHEPSIQDPDQESTDVFTQAASEESARVTEESYAQTAGEASDQTTEDATSVGTSDMPGEPGAQIVFNNVCFRYEEESENVLDQVSFTAYPGQTLAIVGATGSGKSTIMKLIERFYDVNEGSVTVDGVDVRAIPQADLRAKFGYVPQKAFLFSGTVASNITYGWKGEYYENGSEIINTTHEVDTDANIDANANATAVTGTDADANATAVTGTDTNTNTGTDTGTDANTDSHTEIVKDTYPDEAVRRIQDALEIAQASDFVAERGGLDSVIVQGGENVSGGQRQRLAIARALATGAHTFLFDDSFSALDFKTDAALRHALAQRLHGSTCIIVAQRISTVLDADNIIVLDEGRVVGQGTHSELLYSCEEYRQIAQSQLSEEELELGGGAV